MNIDKILMPTDFSECSQAAFDHALFLAQLFDAELHLFHAVVLYGEAPANTRASYPSFDDIASRLDAIAQTEMGRMLDGQDEQVVHIREIEDRALAAAPAIVAYAEREDIDLIVIGTHGHRGLRRWLVGSVTEEVVRTASCPVLTVRDNSAAERLQKLERIVVPFDFSVDSVRSLDVAKRLATPRGSTIDVLHVTAPTLTAGGMVGAPIIGTTYPDISREIEIQLAQVVSDDDCDFPIKPHVLMGPVAWSITNFSEGTGAGSTDADLIVIATQGLSGLHRLLIGSVAERVVRTATCPVLVLRHRDESEDDIDDVQEARAS